MAVTVEKSQGSNRSRQTFNLRQSVGLLGREISPSQGRCLHTNTEDTQTNIYALTGIRTHDPSVRAGLRPRSHSDRSKMVG
jgi:hypothetical protein